MEYGLQNDTLEVRVQTKGAELTGVRHRQSGREMLWQANPAVWGWHAPLLFPYCGGLYGDVLLANGKAFPAPRHGFARHKAFALASRQEQELALVLRSNAETLAVYPYHFELRVAYRLEQNALLQTVTVTNPGQAGSPVLPFSVGFHPAFSLPLAPGETTENCEILFSSPETPLVVATPGGYVSGQKQPLFKGQSSLPLTDSLFAADSICMEGLVSEALTLHQKGVRVGEGPGVQVGIQGFAHTLLWGPPKGPLPFVCIEPWHGLPDGPARYEDFAQKPGITRLLPGQAWQTTLSMRFFG